MRCTAAVRWHVYVHHGGAASRLGRPGDFTRSGPSGVPDGRPIRIRERVCRLGG